MSAAATSQTSGRPDRDVTRAALWMAGAVASFSLMAVAGRKLSHTLDTFELMMYRSLIGAAIVTAVGAAKGWLPQVRTRRIGLHLVRNIFHFSGQNLWFYGIATIPLAQVFAFEFTTPIWVALLAPMVLGEAMTRSRLIAIALGFIGILVVARPGLSPLGPGHFAAMLCAVGFAGNWLATKELSRGDSVWTILFWMTWMQAAMGLVCAGIDLQIAAPHGIMVLWIAVVGVCGLSAHMCITTALGHAPASIVSPMDFLRLPIIAVVGMLLFGEPLDVWVLVGAGLILAGNMMNIRGARRAAAQAARA